LKATGNEKTDATSTSVDTSADTFTPVKVNDNKVTQNVSTTDVTGVTFDTSITD